MKNIQLILTFFTLWVSVFLNEVFEDYLAYAAILSLGILHGANDIGVGEKTLIQKNINTKKILLVCFYMVMILLVSLLLLNVPSFTLFLFVLLSAYHFGEQHWSNLIPMKLIGAKIFSLSYGLVIFALIFNAHSETVIQIITDITGITLMQTFFMGLLLVSFLIATILYVINFRKDYPFSFIVKQLFYLLIFQVVFNSTSLLWSFAIYFIFWHSLPSLLDQMNYLYGKKNLKTFILFFKASYLYWLVSVMSLALYYYVLKKYYVLELSMFFAFLTALTIPHIFLMYFLKKSE